MKIKIGGIWEQSEFEIKLNYRLDKSERDTAKCKHIINGRVKYLIECKNEGGYNSTGTCGECIIEAINKIENGTK